MEGKPYIAYLRAKKVEINPLPDLKCTGMTRDQIAHSVKAELLIKDRGLLDKASNAFVSFLRYYKEH